MRHPVTFVLEVAEAAITTGEVTVELFAGVETATLTDADANIDKEITHRTMDSVHRITTFLLKGLLCAAVGNVPGSPAQHAGICVLRSGVQGICAKEGIELGGQPNQL
jgi:hypothetical protein